MRTLSEIKDELANKAMKEWGTLEIGWEQYCNVILDLGKFELLDSLHDEACNIYAEEFAKEFADFATSHIDDTDESMIRFKQSLDDSGS